MLRDVGSPLGPGDDLLSMAEEALEKEDSSRSIVEKEMALFLQKYKQFPHWVDLDQVRRGQEVFLAYLPVASLSLYYRSLVAGFSIPKIAAVVHETAYLAPPSRPDQVLQRLLDTGELTAACMGLGVDALLPGNIGWKTAMHVRILHAKVRFALLNRQGKKKWDVEKYGIPINQEDMAATLLAFSVNVLFGIDLMAGISLPDQERLDYLALWRYIGWILGVETEFEERLVGQPSLEELPPLDPCGPGVRCAMPNPIKNSASILQSVIFHLLDPDEFSVEIAHHLLKITDRRPPSMSMRKIPDEFYKNELFYYRCYNCRRMIGGPLADALELPLHHNRWIRLKIYAKSTFFFSLFRAYTVVSMSFQWARKFIVSRHRRALVYFHEEWEKKHVSKLRRALSRNEKSSVLEDDNDDSTQHTADNDTAEMMKVCPFAMTAKPTC
jgi:hypothetical protein